MTDSAHCPRCGRLNHCAQATRREAVEDCWCFHAPIDQQRLAELPAELRGKSCLCPNCAKADASPPKTD